MWRVYLVLCSDGTLYCGIALDVEARVRQHNEGKGARYTRGRRPVRLVWFSNAITTRSEATREERYIKKLTREEKWDIILGYINPIGAGFL